MRIDQEINFTYQGILINRITKNALQDDAKIVIKRGTLPKYCREIKSGGKNGKIGEEIILQDFVQN